MVVAAVCAGGSRRGSDAVTIGSSGQRAAAGVSAPTVVIDPTATPTTIRAWLALDAAASRVTAVVPVQQSVRRHQRVDGRAADVADDHQAAAINGVDQRPASKLAATCATTPSALTRPIFATDPVASNTSRGRATMAKASPIAEIVCPDQ
jgi:hypothetical protein